MTRLSFFASLLVLVWAASARADFYLLVVKSGTIASTKASGYNWDFWPYWAPDPYVRVFVYEGEAGEQVDYGETAYLRGTYEPAWNHQLANVAEGDRIKIEVWDKDVRYDDLVGSCTFTLTRDMVRNRAIVLRFGQMEELRIELKPSP